MNAAGNTFSNSTMKYQEKELNLFKVNNEYTRGTSMFLNVSLQVNEVVLMDMDTAVPDFVSTFIFHMLFHFVHKEQGT